MDHAEADQKVDHQEVQEATLLEEEDQDKVMGEDGQVQTQANLQVADVVTHPVNNI